MEVGAKINPDTDVCPIRNNDALSSYKKEYGLPTAQRVEKGGLHVRMNNSLS